MKISKTNTDRADDRKVKSVKKSGDTERAGKGKGRPQARSKSAEEDTVSISAGALAAANVSEAEEIQAAAEIDGPLPDPMETSQAILDKEFSSSRGLNS